MGVKELPEGTLRLAIIIASINAVLTRLISVWLPFYIALGLSFFLLMFIVYRVHPRNSQYKLIKWTVLCVLLTAILTIVAFLASSFFERGT
jgi:hypothetical protein